jgi:alpha-beta hydrolase superfamily lysophospholipase
MNPQQLAGGPRIEWHSAADGYRCAVRRWEAERPVARLVLVHGIVSHGGWYLRTCRFLAARRFDVHFLERRGSGLNLPRRGDVARYEQWLEDVEAYLESIGDDAPRVLLGISWGGKLVAALARRRPDLVSALALICPGLFARQFPGPLKYAALGSLRTCGLGEKRVPIPLQDPALFTDAASWQDYIRHDPLLLRQVTVRFALEDRRLTRFARESPSTIRTPSLLMLAGRDRIVDNRATEAFFDRLATNSKERLVYPESAHTLEFEAEGHPYCRDLAAWLHGNLPGKPAR